MSSKIKGKVAIITGANRGIGKSIALNFANQGCNVVLTARNKEKLSEVEKLCKEKGVEVLTIAGDIANKDFTDQIVNETIEKFQKIDLLIHNAGVFAQANYLEADLEEFENMMDINVRAVMRLTKLSLPHLVKQKSSAVILISSVAGKMVFPSGAGYCASKHALIGFAGALFEDVRESGVKVCSVCPGFVNTDMVADKGLNQAKMIQPDDIAETVSFVANFPTTGCPTEIVISPQFTPYN